MGSSEIIQEWFNASYAKPINDSWSTTRPVRIVIFEKSGGRRGNRYESEKIGYSLSFAEKPNFAIGDEIPSNERNSFCSLRKRSVRKILSFREPGVSGSPRKARDRCSGWTDGVRGVLCRQVHIPDILYATMLCKSKKFEFFFLLTR